MQEDISFHVRVVSIDPEGKKFDKVSRLLAVGVDQEVKVTLDYHSHIISPQVNDALRMTLLFSDISGSDLQRYSLVMSGKIFKMDEKEQESGVCISFGGLLCKIESSIPLLSRSKVGDECKLCLKLK
jgi:hypothetical protein